MKETQHPIFKEILKSERLRMGMTMQQFADKLRSKEVPTDKSRIVRYEAGNTGLSRQRLEEYLVKSGAQKKKGVKAFVSKAIIKYEKQYL